MERELLRETGIVILVILVLFSAAVVLFFAEGGEIRGINHDPNAPSKPLEHSKYAFEVVDEEIIPIYDGTEIKSVELWELPLKDTLVTLITSPMAYIPPITAQLIGFVISTLGLAFLVLYRRKDSRENRQENGRPEQIRTLLTEHPGRSLQQIADVLGISHSTARHYLRRLKKGEQISLLNYHGHPHYFAGGKSYTKVEKLMYIILSREKEEQVITAIREHPGITKRELAGKLRLTLATCNWHLGRLLDDGLLMIIFDGVHNKYRLTNEATDAYKKNLTDQATTTDLGSTASGQ
ncbi:MAG: winged helix-turn-helix transcriptional regulator [Methanocalculaceae archaeon]|jgi:predicted transcriptional regulator|nr:winged helix-turn-helix transcriptional regulator [Methanocalculaceae archaeon]